MVQDQRVYDALRLRLRSARTNLEPNPARAVPPVAVQPAAPAIDARSEGRSGGGAVAAGGGDGALPAAGESSSDAMEGAFGSTADEPKPMDE